MFAIPWVAMIHLSRLFDDISLCYLREQFADIHKDCFVVGIGGSTARALAIRSIAAASESRPSPDLFN